MKLSENMNWIEIGRWIIEQMKLGTDRNEIESEMAKKFKWPMHMSHLATDPYFDEKRYVTRNTKVKRR